MDHINFHEERSEPRLAELLPNPRRHKQAAKKAKVYQPIQMYFANVTSWSGTAREYIEHKIEADVICIIESHCSQKALQLCRRQFDRRGFRASGRPALATGTSERGTSRGCITAVSKRLASHSLGPADLLQQYVTTPTMRYWSGMFLRVAQRDILICSVYLPPGELHCQARHDAMQDLGTLVRQLRCCWILV